MAREKSHENVPGDRGGESDEKTGDHLASVCEEDQLDRGRRDTGIQCAASKTAPGEVRGVRV